MIVNGWLQSARKVESPHYNDRPTGVEISLLVIHNISLPPGQFEGCFVEDFFQARLDCSYHPYFREIADLKVSSHLYIRRDGELLQHVSFEKSAWHAGVSSFAGRNKCNDYSIGIELQGTDELPYTTAQYAQLVKVIAQLRQIFPKITAERIVGHCDIAPGRKTDPGASFDWSAVRDAIT